MAYVWDSQNGNYVDQSTGRRAPKIDGNGNPMDAQGNSIGPNGASASPAAGPQSPFTPDYLANAKLQPNPFRPGTSEFRDFQNQQIQDLKNMAGAPSRPAVSSALDANTGKLKSQFSATPETISPDVINKISMNSVLGDFNKDPLKALEAEGMRSGPSAWNDLMQQQIGNQKLDALDKIGAQAQGANASALSQLAMRGGMGSGASVSLAKDLQRGINAGAQGARRDAANSSLNVNIQDELNRQNILSQLPGQELAALNPALTEQGRSLDTQKANNDSAFNLAKYNADTSNQANQFNVGNALNANLQNNASDLATYYEQMKNYAAGKSANAVAGSGKK